MTPQQLATRHVGKRDPKRHLEDAVEKAMGGMVVQSLGMGVLGEVCYPTLLGSSPTPACTDSIRDSCADLVFDNSYECDA